MKVVGLLVLMMLFSIMSVKAETTTGELFACATEKSLDEAVGYSVGGDKEAFIKMFTDGECILLKAGVKVTIEDSTWSGKIRIRPVGTRESVWTLREAVK